jgi:nucleotide-binding universal stress UspA family protein
MMEVLNTLSDLETASKINFSGGVEMLYNKIFLSLAGNKDESKAIEESLRIVSALDANLTVVHINDPAAGQTHMMMDTLPEVTEDNLVDLFIKAGYGRQVEGINFRLIVDESYAKAIAAATREADLLIMGHHPKNMLMALLTDGTDERVADLIQCPVLLVPLD